MSYQHLDLILWTYEKLSLFASLLSIDSVWHNYNKADTQIWQVYAHIDTDRGVKPCNDFFQVAMGSRRWD